MRKARVRPLLAQLLPYSPERVKDGPDPLALVNAVTDRVLGHEYPVDGGDELQWLRRGAGLGGRCVSGHDPLEPQEVAAPSA